MKNFQSRQLAITFLLFFTVQSVIFGQVVTIQSAANSSKYMSISSGSTSDAAQIVLWGDECQKDQLWRLVPAGSNHVKIQNVNSGKFVACAEGATTNGTALIQYFDAGQQDILWIQETYSNYKRFKNVKSGRYIAIRSGQTENGSQLILWDNNNQMDINWGVYHALVPSEQHVTLSPCSSVLMAAVSNASTDNNAQVILWDTPQDDREWIIEQSPLSGFYFIKNLKSGKYLGIEGGFTQAGKSACITPNIAQTDIYWKITPVSANAFTLQNRKSNLFLGIADGAIHQRGAKVVQWRNENQLDIRWQFHVILN